MSLTPLVEVLGKIVQHCMCGVWQDIRESGSQGGWSSVEVMQQQDDDPNIKVNLLQNEFKGRELVTEQSPGEKLWNHLARAVHTWLPKTELRQFWGDGLFLQKAVQDLLLQKMLVRGYCCQTRLDQLLLKQVHFLFPFCLSILVT